jgi:hypothetical protein
MTRLFKPRLDWPFLAMLAIWIGITVNLYIQGHWQSAAIVLVIMLDAILYRFSRPSPSSPEPTPEIALSDEDARRPADLEIAETSLRLIERRAHLSLTHSRNLEDCIKALDYIDGVAGVALDRDGDLVKRMASGMAMLRWALETIESETLEPHNDLDGANDLLAEIRNVARKTLEGD